TATTTTDRSTHTSVSSDRRISNGSAAATTLTTIQIPVSDSRVASAASTFGHKNLMNGRILSGTNQPHFSRRSTLTRTLSRALAALAIVATCGLAPAAAQTGQMFGELVGKVTDDQGGVLPGVTVTLSGPAAMGSPTTVSNEQGRYRFPAVNSGTYTLKFELAGFAPLVREGIVVPVRQTITVDAAMKLASLQETVTVSGSSPTVDVENTKVGARLS